MRPKKQRVSTTTPPQPGAPDPPPQDQKLNPYAAGAGLGSGTLLAALADNLSDSNDAKSWLVILAPAVGIAISYGWGYVKDYLDDWVANRVAKQYLGDAIRFNDEIINDPQSSADEKEEARKEKAALRRIYAKASRSRFRARIRDE